MLGTEVYRRLDIRPKEMEVIRNMEIYTICALVCPINATWPARNHSREAQQSTLRFWPQRDFEYSLDAPEGLLPAWPSYVFCAIQMKPTNDLLTGCSLQCHNDIIDICLFAGFLSFMKLFSRTKYQGTKDRNVLV